ncbi:hypothetical protein LEP1GSC047_0531 [Leptospira inadai serovar Lyme str. 10]|uniref:Uncharacterized protein n=1 Tax=Leptospira inadai serovar Lyme str. 10 TaxID=1049790 RepID=V6HA18_9LEPT|nr:hypothetical protein LEP1GSC047_0531 [Leptospira inadai serovar Lyme str. 10]
MAQARKNEIARGRGGENPSISISRVRNRGEIVSPFPDPDIK